MADWAQSGLLRWTLFFSIVCVAMPRYYGGKPLDFENLPEKVRAEIFKEIRARRKLDAVKLYRDATGESLLNCKIAVESLMDEQAKNMSANSQERAESQMAGFHDQVLDAVFRNQKLDAMKIYMENTGTSLLEAKKFIEDLTDRLKVEAGEQFEPEGSGCLGLILFALVSGVLWVSC